MTKKRYKFNDVKFKVLISNAQSGFDRTVCPVVICYQKNVWQIDCSTSGHERHCNQLYWQTQRRPETHLEAVRKRKEGQPVKREHILLFVSRFVLIGIVCVKCNLYNWTMYTWCTTTVYYYTVQCADIALLVMWPFHTDRIAHRPFCCLIMATKLSGVRSNFERCSAISFWTNLYQFDAIR